MDISSINVALDTLKRLHAIAKNIEHAEFRNLLADLSNQLADAKLKIVSLKDQVVSLKEELSKARGPAPREKWTLIYGAYKFEGDNHLYCPACYERSGKKHVTNRLSTRFRQCTVCQRQIASG